MAYDPRQQLLVEIISDCDRMQITAKEYAQMFLRSHGHTLKDSTVVELRVERDRVRDVRKSMDNPPWPTAPAPVTPRPLRDEEVPCPRCERIGIAQMVPCIHDTGEANEPGRRVQEWERPVEPSHRIFGL